MPRVCPGSWPGWGQCLTQCYGSLFCVLSSKAVNLLPNFSSSTNNPTSSFSMWCVMYIAFPVSFKVLRGLERGGQFWTCSNSRGHFLSVVRLCREASWEVLPMSQVFGATCHLRRLQHFLNLRVKGNGLLYPKPSNWSVCQVLCNLSSRSSLIISVIGFIMLVQHLTE